MNRLEQAIIGDERKPDTRGRFAPSPTGRMHLGNIYAALMSYLSVKSRGGRWVLRIEDIDRQRSHREYAELLMDDLKWLGLQWDEGPYYQSERDDIYNRYLRELSELGLLYSCHCTRAELLASSAPHASDGHHVYSGKCRPEMPYADAWMLAETLRLRIDHTHDSTPSDTNRSMITDKSQGVTIGFTDEIHGPQQIALADYFGDFVVRRRDGAWAYQFAVAIDDALMGITEVVRGDDLLTSTAPQRYISDILRLHTPQRYIHLPLLRNREGRRLSKRDNSLSMESLRLTHSPEAVIKMVCDASDISFDKVMEVIS